MFGLAGGLISIYVTKGLRLSTRARWKLACLLGWTVFSVYPDREVDNAAHVGGLMAGVMLGALLSSPFPQSPRRLRQLIVATAVLVVASGAAVCWAHRDLIPLRFAARDLAWGHTDDALFRVKAILRQTPNNVLANDLASSLYLEKKDYVNAEAAARRALTVDREDDEALFALGTVEFATGRCSEGYRLAGELSFRKNHAQALRFVQIGCNEAATNGPSSRSEGVDTEHRDPSK